MGKRDPSDVFQGGELPILSRSAKGRIIKVGQRSPEIGKCLFVEVIPTRFLTRPEEIVDRLLWTVCPIVMQCQLLGELPKALLVQGFDDLCHLPMEQDAPPMKYRLIDRLLGQSVPE